MGKGNNPLAPMNKLVGKLDPVANQTNKTVEDYFGKDPTRKDEGLKKQEPTTVEWGNNGTSSRTVATSGTTGSVEEVYDKKDTKR